MWSFLQISVYVFHYLLPSLRVNRSIGKAKLYKIDRSSPMIKTITEFERKLSMQIADQEEAKTKHSIAATQYFTNPFYI